MERLRQLPWLRIVAEGSAIVVSILLAFAIDAWWARQAEAEHRDALLESLHADFTVSQAHLAQWRAGNERIHAALTRFRERLVATPPGAELIVPEDWLIAAVSTPTYSPTDATLQAAISSGQLDLIRDQELRSLLALWRQQVDDTAEDELLVRRIVVDRFVPALADEVRLGRIFEFERIIDWFLGRDGDVQYGEIRLRSRSDIEGLLAERIFYSTFVTRQLPAIEETQARILDKLDTLRNGD